jgi:2-polyprenyl-6-methoxyphenol hydroxylase-like FAD-dependent oxidoreductase
MSQKPISIIGAGIAGLTLGRALLKHGIKATIYDRKKASSRHSYAITLHASTWKRLLTVLSIDESEFCCRVAVEGGGKIDPSKLNHPAPITPSCFKAHRGKLEDLLREGLDVRWEHAVDGVDRSSSGVIVHLSTKQDLENTLVIGADGPHSKVRNGLLPDVVPEVLPYVAFNGKRRIDLRTFADKYAPEFSDSVALEKRAGDTILSLSIFDRTEENISVSWIYSRPAHGDDDPLHRPERAPTGATDTPQEFFNEITSVQDLTEPFRDIFDADKLRKERILHWLMRTVEIDSNDLAGLSKDDVILIGDAAHAEPIIGGEGANNAIMEAIEIAEVLAKGTHGVGLADFVETQNPKWREDVSESKIRIAQVHGVRQSNL